MKSIKEKFEDFAKFEAEVNLKKLKELEIGKYVLCESQDFTNRNRLFIHRFDSYNSAISKDGWWDTFTLSNENVSESGYYICKIIDFRLDKNGFLNMIVKPEKYLGTFIDEDSDAWNYFFRSNCFSKHYDRSYHKNERFNLKNLHKVYAEDLKDVFIESEKRYPKGVVDEELCAKFLMGKFFKDEITLEEIENSLNERYDEEKLAEDLNCFPEKYCDDFPLLVKKLPKNVYGNYTTEDTLSFLERKDTEYYTLKLGAETDYLKRVESVLGYWDAIKEKEKEERKQRRKENKKKNL